MDVPKRSARKEEAIITTLAGILIGAAIGWIGAHFTGRLSILVARKCNQKDPVERKYSLKEGTACSLG